MGVQKGPRWDPDRVHMGSKRGSSRGSRLRGPCFVPTLAQGLLFFKLGHIALKFPVVKTSSTGFRCH